MALKTTIRMYDKLEKNRFMYHTKYYGVTNKFKERVMHEKCTLKIRFYEIQVYILCIYTYSYACI